MIRISAQELENIDLDELDHLDAHGLAAHFRLLALRARPGQLRSVLDLPIPATDDGPMERRALVETYVNRYTEISLRLREARKGFSSFHAKKESRASSSVRPDARARKIARRTESHPMVAEPHRSEPEEVEFLDESEVDQEEDAIGGPGFG